MQVLPLVSFQEMIPSQQDEEFPKRGRIRVIGLFFTTRTSTYGVRAKGGKLGKEKKEEKLQIQVVHNTAIITENSIATCLLGNLGYWLLNEERCRQNSYVQFKQQVTGELGFFFARHGVAFHG